MTSLLLCSPGEPALSFRVATQSKRKACFAIKKIVTQSFLCVDFVDSLRWMAAFKVSTFFLNATDGLKPGHVVKRQKLCQQKLG